MGTIEEPEFNFSRVYQASRGDINTIKFSNFFAKCRLIKKCVVEMTEEQYERAVIYLEEQTGKGYGEWTALAATFKLLRKLGIGKNGDSEFICSEYMARMMEVAFHEDFSGRRKHTDYVDPLEFEKILTEKGYEIVDL
jgi:hypothetical protein